MEDNTNKNTPETKEEVKKPEEESKVEKKLVKDPGTGEMITKK